jgi:WD40 repeat protein
VYQDNGISFVLNQRLKAHKKMVHSIDFTTDGYYMATGSWDSCIILWKRMKSQFSKIGELQEHKKQVYDIAFHPNGKILASGSEDNTVLIWQIQF